jgi:tetratricopeptide (TPR) repeat protein
VCRLGLLANPSLVEGRLVLGMALMALGRYDDVLAEMRVALEVEANNVLATLLKGEALFYKGDHEQAKEVLERAQKLDPKNDKPESCCAKFGWRVKPA